MKVHIALACILGSLTVGYTALADFAIQPDSIDHIAYVNNGDYSRLSRRFLRSSGSIRQIIQEAEAPRKRGVTALV